MNYSSKKHVAILKAHCQSIMHRHLPNGRLHIKQIHTLHTNAYIHTYIHYTHITYVMHTIHTLHTYITYIQYTLHTYITYMHACITYIQYKLIYIHFYIPYMHYIHTYTHACIKYIPYHTIYACMDAILWISTYVHTSIKHSVAWHTLHVQWRDMHRGGRERPFLLYVT